MNFEKLVLEIKNESPLLTPSYAKEGDSGFDLRAWLYSNKDEEYNKDLSITLKPLERVLVHTGNYLNIPDNYEVQIRPRSGCAYKQGLVVANTPGTIDTEYIGEICIIALNLSNEDITIMNGDRIAQAVVCPVMNSRMVDLVIVDEIVKQSERGSSGFGDSGKQ